MTKQCFINVNYIYNHAFMVISGYLSIIHMIFV